MAVNMPTAIGAAGTTAFGAQSLVPVIHWLGEHYQVQPAFTPELEYSLALIAIGAGGAVIGTGLIIGRALLARWMKDHNLEIPPETEKPDA
jgi:hypothetical protein